MAQSKVLCYIPTLPAHPTIPTQQESPFQAIISSLPIPALLREANSAFKSQVMSEKPLDSPAQRYAKNLTHTSERLATQVAILRKVNKEQELILKKQKKRPSGKRAAMQGHFILSMVKIRDKVLAAELETAQKKGKKRRVLVWLPADLVGLSAEVVRPPEGSTPMKNLMATGRFGRATGSVYPSIIDSI
ncbi:MAG: hypothetical protein M1840_008919 [Geoglossum simile]|nr:MAG: hypothetical protein M1840_008919 [Geoglossum simile]